MRCVKVMRGAFRSRRSYRQSVEIWCQLSHDWVRKVRNQQMLTKADPSLPVDIVIPDEVTRAPKPE